MNWLKKLFTRKTKNHFHMKYEQSNAVGLLDEFDQTILKKQRLINYKETLLRKEEDLKQYELLDEQDINQLTLYIGQYREIEEKKQHLKGRLIKNNRGLRILAEYENDLPHFLQEVIQTERKLKENERDLYYLEEEKEELKEEREVLLRGYSFLKSASVCFILAMIVFLFMGFAMLQVLRENIWIYLSVVSVILIFGLIGMLFAKDRLERNLKDNEKLQKKVVKYLNKVKIRYFNNYSYLQFYFDKLGVDSAAKLELYYNRYIKNKNNEIEYSKYNRSLMELEFSIKEIFENKGLSYDEQFESLEEWILAPKKAIASKQLKEEKEKVLDQIEVLESYEAELFKEISILKEDPNYTKLIEDRLSVLDKEKIDA